MSHECIVYQIPTTLPPPLLYRLKRQYGLVDFVETGTWFGDTAILAALCFERVYTIELFPELFESGAKRLDEFSNVTRLSGHSPAVLFNLRPRLTRPTLFWLDAHWSGLPEAKPEKECPVVDELAVIAGSPHAQEYVIVIDDARYFIAAPPPPHDSLQWPTLRGIAGMAEVGWGPGSLVHIGDQLIITPRKGSSPCSCGAEPCS